MDTKLREKTHTNSTCNKEEINYYVGVEYLCLGSRYEVEKRELNTDVHAMLFCAM